MQKIYKNLISKTKSRPPHSLMYLWHTMVLMETKVSFATLAVYSNFKSFKIAFNHNQRSVYICLLSYTRWDDFKQIRKMVTNTHVLEDYSRNKVKKYLAIYDVKLFLKNKSIQCILMVLPKFI